MTSKNLFFKLMREDLKRRIWALGLAFLSFFFGMPVAAAMGASSISQSYQRWVAEWGYLLRRDRIAGGGAVQPDDGAGGTDRGYPQCLYCLHYHGCGGGFRADRLYVPSFKKAGGFL